ncbi:Predicted metal-dependent hydrolase of the TIM-barrel fold [Paenibacillus uliginis N3/975]|uniref:Predicted metal-dependent hydrolase of the TIM-barrel fold n=1 Tax=Paenibacillus uliginis N3/975 TaxID=1313296 RepID=A0A1X7G5T5_9BACL|nr:amidohydrolase family protein [Paenibacillus uliginis]SMF64462.1 Predicted metal-dependent hydrolase of the TIM-barrel fold [Paenibacillus uliginis N3/975]
MPRKKLRNTLCILSLGVSVLAACSSGSGSNVIVEPLTDYKPSQELDLIQKIRTSKDTSSDVQELYRDITLIDIHNHDASNPNAVKTWTDYGIDRIVLFGSISEPSAKVTDQLAWDHYRKNPSHVYPSFAGFPVYDEEGLSVVKENLEQGYLNIGEIAAASTYSPIVSKLEWKSEHPNDGYLPKIYELAATYRVPVLLHIDPPNGPPIEHLKQALEQHPDTTFIFGHANAYNMPENIKPLLEKYPNLYIDFFAGFTAYSPDSKHKLEDYVPLMEQYPDRFMLSTDSGYGLNASHAAHALYEIIDLLTPETAQKAAYQNYERLIELQPPTDTQIAKIKELSAKLGEKKTYRLNKRMANELIFELEQTSEKAK